MNIITSNRGSRYYYDTEVMEIDSRNKESNMFLLMLHEYGHHIATDYTSGVITREVEAWDWVKDHMGDFPLDIYESVRNRCINTYITTLEDIHI